MAGLPGVLLVLASLGDLTTGFIPGLLPGPGLKPPGGLLGTPGSPLLSGIFNGLSSKIPSGQLHVGPGGVRGEGNLPGVAHVFGGITPSGGGTGLPASPLLGLLNGGFLPPGLGGPSPPTGPTASVGAGSTGTQGGSGSSPTSTGSGGSGSNADSSEEDTGNKKSKAGVGSPSPGSRGREKLPKAPLEGSAGSAKNKDSSEEKDNNQDASSSYRSRSTKKPSSKRGSRGSHGSRHDGKSSEETDTKKKKESEEDGRDSREKSRRRKKSGKRKPKRRLEKDDDDDKRRKKRSVMDEFGLMGIKGAHQPADNVPDHVKLVYCGRNEVPNPGGIEDHFCHPEATWETLLRMRPDCICQQGYLRNSWGECISPAECDHCSDKHHLNMDYHLCESPCPIVCNQPIDENCANMCFKECACRPGYIRAYPNGPCVSIKQCLPGCRGRNQVFSLCSSLCPPTCRKPVPKRCPKVCAGEGCVCKPGYVVKRWEPLECVRPEDCPGRRRKCPGPNQRYTRCIRRCVPSCFKRRHRYCGHECLGRGCVCKRGYVALQRRPLVCVPRDQCPKRRKTCPARNQVYMYCKSKCPRTCDNPKPRRCAWACDGEGCACKPGYVVKQEDPLICVRHYQCSSEFDGLEMLKGAKGGIGGAKGRIGGAKGGMGAEEAKGGLGAKGGIGEKGGIRAEEAKKVMGADEAEGAKEVEGTKRRRKKKGSSKRRKPSWEFSPQ